MQKTLLALAVMAASGAAMAQSSVTLFGTVDNAVTVYDGKERVTGLGNSGLSNSALGFRGVEDLGGGAKAEFWLEGAVGSDDGSGIGGGATGAFEFKRRSSLSLHANWGELRMGRYLTAAYQSTSRYDPFGTNGVGASRVWAQGGYPVRRDNMVGYYSPNWSGLKLAINSAFGEDANGSDDGSYLGGSLTYDNGPLSLGLGVERFKTLPISTVELSDKTTAYNLGAAYQFGGFKLSTAYMKQKSKGFAGETLREYDNFLLGLTAKVGATGTMKVSYNRYDEDRTNAKADQFALGYVQDLSKRTAVYGTYAYIKNKNDGRSFALGGAGLSNGHDASNLDNGGKMHGLQVGVRHSF